MARPPKFLTLTLGFVTVASAIFTVVNIFRFTPRSSKSDVSPKDETGHGNQFTSYESLPPQPCDEIISLSKSCFTPTTDILPTHYICGVNRQSEHAVNLTSVITNFAKTLSVREIPAHQLLAKALFCSIKNTYIRVNRNNSLSRAIIALRSKYEAAQIYYNFTHDHHSCNFQPASVRSFTCSHKTVYVINLCDGYSDLSRQFPESSKNGESYVQIYRNSQLQAFVGVVAHGLNFYGSSPDETKPSQKKMLKSCVDEAIRCDLFKHSVIHPDCFGYYIENTYLLYVGNNMGTSIRGKTYRLRGFSPSRQAVLEDVLTHISRVLHHITDSDPETWPQSIRALYQSHICSDLNSYSKHVKDRFKTMLRFMDGSVAFEFLEIPPYINGPGSTYFGVATQCDFKKEGPKKCYKEPITFTAPRFHSSLYPEKHTSASLFTTTVHEVAHASTDALDDVNCTQLARLPSCGRFDKEVNKEVHAWDGSVCIATFLNGYFIAGIAEDPGQHP